MLVLSRKVGDEIVLGQNIRIIVLAADRAGVRIGVEAPDDVSIMRGEIVAAIAAENRLASQNNVGALAQVVRVRTASSDANGIRTSPAKKSLEVGAAVVCASKPDTP